MSDRETPAAASALSELRRRFKEICEATDKRFQNYQIRVHRALSWWERAGELDAEELPEARLIFNWIAFNSLYGSWDGEGGAPVGDRASWGAFLSRILRWGRQGLLASRLQELRDPVLKLFENRFLDQQFWRLRDAYGNSRRPYFLGQSLYFERRWAKLLEMVFDRSYVLRSQIVHGAATRNSRLNREVLREVLRLLEGFLEVVLTIVVESGAHDDWPALCYPPIEVDTNRRSAQIKRTPR